MRILTISALFSVAVAVSGCAVTTAGVKKGDERNFVRSLNDVSAGRAIKARLNRASSDFNLKGVDVEVAEGIVVLTGHAPTAEDRVEAERIAWSGPNVLQVGNEIRESGKAGIFADTADIALNTSIRTRLIADRTVKSRNINIETYGGTVYLLGVARTPQELERAAQIASTTRGAKDVISYIKLDGADVQSASFINPTPGMAVPAQRTLPDFVTQAPQGVPQMTQPQASQPAVPQISQPHVSGPSVPSAPQRPQSTAEDLPPLAPGEPYYRDPITGKRITLPPGTVTIPMGKAPATPSAPSYIDPATGQKIQIIHRPG